jgi:hypothetical protein
MVGKKIGRPWKGPNFILFYVFWGGNKGAKSKHHEI